MRETKYGDSDTKEPEYGIQGRTENQCHPRKKEMLNVYAQLHGVDDMYGCSDLDISLFSSCYAQTNSWLMLFFTCHCVIYK